MCNGNTTITITITATAATPYPPKISDGTTTVSDEPGDIGLVTAVSPNFTIKFVKAGDITKIEIIENVGSENLFSSNPTAANNWTGVIGSFPSTSEEEYTINYWIGNTKYTLDPRLRMK